MGLKLQMGSPGLIKYIRHISYSKPHPLLCTSRTQPGRPQRSPPPLLPLPLNESSSRRSGLPLLPLFAALQAADSGSSVSIIE